jgi:hypothetical protein
MRGEVMKEYRYRIQVGDEYTYRESGLELDQLIRNLADNLEYNQLDALLAKARGNDAPAQKRRTAKLEEIKITVEQYTPPKEEKWHKCEE